MTCKHKIITAWRFEDGEPCELWSCRSCNLKFYPADRVYFQEDLDAVSKQSKDALIQLMLELGLSTGHGDTMEDVLNELELEIKGLHTRIKELENRK